MCSYGMSSVIWQYRWIDGWNRLKPAMPFHYTRAHRILYCSYSNKHKSLFHDHPLLLLCVPDHLHVASSPAAAPPGFNEVKTFKVISPSLLKWLHIHRRWKYSLPWTEGSGGESYNGWEESGRWSEKIQRAQGWRRWRREIKGRWTEDMSEMGGIRRENANHLLLSPSHLSLSSPPRQHSLPCSISLFLYVFLHCCPFSFPSLHSFLL